MEQQPGSEPPQGATAGAAVGENFAAGVARLPLARITPNPLQPRHHFAEAQLEALAQSLNNQGVLQPLVVRHHPERNGDYQLIAGERRLRAMHRLGWQEAPALVRDVADEALLETALVENLQREPLSPVEEAQALRNLMQHHGYTQEALARRIGCDRSTIANLVRLLALPAAILDDLDSGALTVGHARALLPLEDAALQLGMRNEVLRRGMSVRQAERLVRTQIKAPATELAAPTALGSNQSRTGRSQPRGTRPLPDVENIAYAAATTTLERHLGTRVRIDHHQQRGSISIAFADLEDFNRIYDLLTGR